jgi:hypothetical protein
MKRYFKIRVQTKDGRGAMYHVYADMAQQAFNLATGHFRSHGSPKAKLITQCIQSGLATSGKGKTNYVRQIQKWGFK